MDAIVEIAKKNDALLHVDEIYRGAELEGDETATFYGLYGKSHCHHELCRSPTPCPACAWAGWWVPKALMEKGWAYHDYTSISTTIVSQYVKCHHAAATPGEGSVSGAKTGQGKSGGISAVGGLPMPIFFTSLPPRAGGMAWATHYNMDYESPRNCRTTQAGKKRVHHTR